MQFSIKLTDFYQHVCQATKVAEKRNGHRRNDARFGSAKEKDFPKSELRWSQFSALAATDMQAALDLWEGVKQFAREELATGERTCEAVFPNSKPLERARHFAVREEMSEGWKPQTASSTPLGAG